MDILTNPAILFFVFGILAGVMKSNLELPQAVAKFLSMYLLMSIGLKGGLALSQSGLTVDVFTIMALAIFMAFLVPLISYRFLRIYLNGFDASAVAATYGSISAVTFVTASQYLTNLGIAYDGYMSAAMALMESPAIIIAVLFSNNMRRNADTSVGHILKDSFVEGANLLLLASLAIGVLAGTEGYDLMKPFAGDLFSGLLAFFLLDMGLQVAKNIPQLKGKSPVLLAYALIAPLLHACLALGACLILGIGFGNTILMMVLVASASYIAVPAALRHAIPEASPSLYLGLSLGITFPFNVILGIPLYHAMASYMM